jgi:hypothetical protein
MDSNNTNKSAEAIEHLDEGGVSIFAHNLPPLPRQHSGSKNSGSNRDVPGQFFTNLAKTNLANLGHTSVLAPIGTAAPRSGTVPPRTSPAGIAPRFSTTGFHFGSTNKIAQEKSQEVDHLRRQVEMLTAQAKKMELEKKEMAAALAQKDSDLIMKHLELEQNSMSHQMIEDFLDPDNVDKHSPPRDEITSSHNSQPSFGLAQRPPVSRSQSSTAASSSPNAFALASQHAWDSKPATSVANSTANVKAITDQIGPHSWTPMHSLPGPSTGMPSMSHVYTTHVEPSRYIPPMDFNPGKSISRRSNAFPGHLRNANLPQGLNLNTKSPLTNMFNGTLPETPFSALSHQSSALSHQSSASSHNAMSPGYDMAAAMHMQKQTLLSPTAAEFNVAGRSNNWNGQFPPLPSPGVHMMSLHTGRSHGSMRSPVNPNDTDWMFVVQKIVHGSDQQASILMQQKIKTASQDEKFQMCEAIVAHCMPLAANRFGNFLVQRCLEHGTPQQIDSVAQCLSGHIVDLSKDSFGCHVVQKAFDTVDEHYKAAFVGEMLHDIRETVIHRYACHVWQKLFELRWENEPPQIMQVVNSQLRGRWVDVALGETSSLVVQNIFENCVEEDKRPCIEEVIENIDMIAHGQFGNWCIQHICENGAENDRHRAVNHILQNAATYSTDQYASKVVEKCLKVGSNSFLTCYLDRVCELPAGRTRSALIDIASDQYGNYLIQWIIQNSGNDQRDRVTTQIR